MLAPEPGHLSSAQQAALTLAVSLAVTWNQFGVGFRAAPPV
jgi:hypothetical protein